MFTQSCFSNAVSTHFTTKNSLQGLTAAQAPPVLTSSPVFSAKPQCACLVSSGFPSFCPPSHWAENDDMCGSVIGGRKGKGLILRTLREHH